VAPVLTAIWLTAIWLTAIWLTAIWLTAIWLTAIISGVVALRRFAASPDPTAGR
jgi:hypothetical protein